MQYDAYICPQLAEEAQQVSAHAAKAAGAQDIQATKDAIATTVGVIVFWPSLFFIGGGKQSAAEVARLKGEMDATEQTSIQKKCGIQFRQAQAPLAALAGRATVALYAIVTLYMGRSG